MKNVKKEVPKQKTKNGMGKLVQEFRSRFRIQENINNYSEDTLKEAERKFIKYSLLGQLSSFS